MSLGDKLILVTELVTSGTILTGVLFLGYHTLKASQIMKRVREDTTKFLDTFTAYAAPRASRPEEIRGLAELAKTRAKYGL